MSPADRVGQRVHAIAAFATALVLDPTDAAIYVNLGRLALSRGDALSARERFSEALLLDPSPARRGTESLRQRSRDASPEGVRRLRVFG